MTEQLKRVAGRSEVSVLVARVLVSVSSVLGHGPPAQ